MPDHNVSAAQGFMSVAECAKLLRCCRQSVYNKLREGSLKAIKLGRFTRIPTYQLLKGDPIPNWVRANTYVLCGKDRSAGGRD